MKKKIAIALTAILAIGLAGCGGSSSSADSASSAAASSAAAESTAAESTVTEAKDDSDIAIGAIVKTTTSEYWSYVIAGCEAAGEDLGIKVDIVGPQSETSYDEQNAEIENYISSGQYDAIALAALQPDSVGKVLGDPGIPVVMFDNDAESESKVSYVGCGNVNASYEGGKYAIEEAKKRGEVKNVVLIAGIQGNPSSTLREEGFGKAIEEAGLELAAMQYADWTADKASQVMENIITSLNGDIDLVFCCNDDMASGAAKALSQAGILEDVYLCGFDGIQSGVESVIAGDEDLTIAQEPFQVGYTAVETAYKAAKGETVEENIDTGFKLITPDIAEEYLETLKGLVG